MIADLPTINLFQIGHTVRPDACLDEMDGKQELEQRHWSEGNSEDVAFGLRLRFLLLFGFVDELAEFVDGGDVGGMQGVLVGVAPRGGLLFERAA